MTVTVRRAADPYAVGDFLLALSAYYTTLVDDTLAIRAATALPDGRIVFELAGSDATAWAHHFERLRKDVGRTLFRVAETAPRKPDVEPRPATPQPMLGDPARAIRTVLWTFARSTRLAQHRKRAADHPTAHLILAAAAAIDRLGGEARIDVAPGTNGRFDVFFTR